MKLFFLIATLFILHCDRAAAVPPIVSFIQDGELKNPGTEHPGGMHPKAQLDFVRRKVKNREQPFYDAYLQLIHYADSALQPPTHALADFNGARR